MHKRRVAVVGGGWAGLAAAVDATAAGHAVTLYDMAPHWGGRARRVDIDGLALDNGQHILIGAYRETLRLMRHVGVDTDAALQRSPLHVTGPNGRGLVLPAGSPVVSFVRGVLAQSGWTISERLRLLAHAAGWGMSRFRCADATTVAELTAEMPGAIRSELIEPLCVAALNTPARDASGSVFLRVLHDALFSGPGSADLLLPQWRLSELFPVPAAAWLAGQGARLRPGTRVEQVSPAAQTWQLDGETFDAVILAATAVEAARLTREVAPSWSALAASLRYEPIVTVYAQSDGTRLSRPLLALASDEEHRPAQFVFDHGQLGQRSGLLAFVISGAQPWLDRGIEQTQTLTIEQGRQALGAQLRGPLQAVRTLTEKRATFRCVPGLMRPPQAIAPGLWAAADYVAGPYPATIEGAVRSAVEAVRALD